MVQESVHHLTRDLSRYQFSTLLRSSTGTFVSSLTVVRSSQSTRTTTTNMGSIFVRPAGDSLCDMSTSFNKKTTRNDVIYFCVVIEKKRAFLLFFTKRRRLQFAPTFLTPYLSLPFQIPIHPFLRLSSFVLVSLLRTRTLRNEKTKKRLSTLTNFLPFSQQKV